MMITKYAVVQVRREYETAVPFEGLKPDWMPIPTMTVNMSCFIVIGKFSSDWGAQDHIDKLEHPDWYIILPIRVKVDAAG